MSEAGSSIGERSLRLKNALLDEILTQDPNHLTLDELALRMEGGPNDTDRIAVLDALQELKRSGLIRLNGEVVEPTFALLRAAEIFEFP
jgi:aryl-alcohol dehydrogenase-like predicted oxidoreductase